MVVTAISTVLMNQMWMVTSLGYLSAIVLIVVMFSIRANVYLGIFLPL